MANWSQHLLIRYWRNPALNRAVGKKGMRFVVFSLALFVIGGLVSTFGIGLNKYVKAVNNDLMPVYVRGETKYLLPGEGHVIVTDLSKVRAPLLIDRYTFLGPFVERTPSFARVVISYTVLYDRRTERYTYWHSIGDAMSSAGVLCLVASALFSVALLPYVIWKRFSG